jgi:hypothetical protein
MKFRTILYFYVTAFNLKCYRIKLNVILNFTILFCFRLKKMLPQILNLSSDLPDEILYGRTGYLFALLYLNKCLGTDTIGSESIQQVRRH